MKKYFYILFTSILSLFVYNCASIKSSAETESFKDTAKPFAQKLDINYIKLKTKEIFVDSINDNHWVDSIYNQMTFDEKVGQLLYGCCIFKQRRKAFCIDR